MKSPSPSDALEGGILILGATGGVGSALAHRLHADGRKLTLAARDEAKLGPLGEKLSAATVLVDATQPEDVERAIVANNESHGSMGALVNCVGSLLLKPGHTTSIEEWDDVIRTNLTSAFLAVKYGTAAMLRRGGMIVLVSSAVAETGMPNHEAIAAAKAGVAGLTRSAAASYANRNIRVNAVAPGLTRSQMTAEIFDNELAKKASQAMHALPRLGEPEDIASAIQWLLSTEWVTGQVLGVDGGLGTLRTRMKA